MTNDKQTLTKYPDWNWLKLLSLLFIGPLGSYITYQYFFVYRYLGEGKYPQLEKIYAEQAYLFDFIFAFICLLLSVILAHRFKFTTFVSRKPSLTSLSLGLLTSVVVFLMILNIYTVLGSFSPFVLIENFDTYYYLNTNGSAWMILLCYIVIYANLIDMYIGGVTKLNFSSTMLNILLVSISGGRGLPVLFVITLLILLMFQNIKLTRFLAAGSAALFSMTLSWSIVTNLRSPGEKVASNAEILRPGIKSTAKPTAPTNNFYDLNYNAAFILNDVLVKLDAGQIKPRAYAAQDALTLFIPRAWYPQKPTSTAETVAVYPEVAKRDTNITFPLKANMMMHVGQLGFYADWFVVGLFQVLLFVGIRRRNFRNDIWGFIFIFWGGAFSMLARGGIFNARMLVQIVCIFLAYAGHQLLCWMQSKLKG